jgi:hypothetical protein
MQAKALALRRQGTFPTVFVSVFVLALSAGPAWPQAEPFLGQAMTTANSSCPKGWSVMAGQTLPINQNQALFALLGTRFGGNGQTTFACPRQGSNTPQTATISLSALLSRAFFRPLTEGGCKAWLSISAAHATDELAGLPERDAIRLACPELHG